MNVFFKDNCPVCSSALISNSNVYIENNTHYYCIEHYQYMITQPGQYANVFLTDKLIISYHDYGSPKTVVMKKNQEGNWKRAFILDHHFELDWKDLESAAKRINNLIIFS